MKPDVSYLTKVGSTYYFRRPVPSDIPPNFLTASGVQRTDWKFSLGTKDRATAKARCNAMTVEYEALVRETRAKLGKGKQVVFRSPHRGQCERRSHRNGDRIVN